jgi:hypothetical protein
VKLAAYALTVSAAYALLAIVAPEAAGALVVLFVALIVVPASVDVAETVQRHRSRRR